MRTRRWFGLVLLTVPAAGQLGKIFDQLGKKPGATSESTAGLGIKQALEIGADHAVDLTGVTDGFFKNTAIKILLPEKLRSTEKALRMVGLGPKLDEFELSMNRAAEKAAPAARSIFKNAITTMTFEDARKIVTGGDTAATEYFKAKTSDDLRSAFRPTVESTMAATGVVQQYKQLTSGLQSLPFGRSQSFDITNYVVDRALSGMFYMIGEEEKKIRTNPASQITPLLRQVFGRR